MNNLSNSIKRSNLLEDIVNRRKGKVNQKYFSPVQRTNIRLPQSNRLVNKTNIKELSKISDKPILVNKRKKHIKKEIYTINGRFNVNTEYNPSIYNNNNILKYRNMHPKKNIVIFTECPKKLSDYILKDKNKNKKKVYQLTYLNENDLDYEKFINEKISQNINSTRDYNPRFIKQQKRIFNLNTYDDENKYLMNNKYASNDNNYININSINRKFNNQYSRKTLIVNNQNNDQLKVIKIQSIWRGYLLRRFLLNNLNIFYNIMKIFNCIYNIFYNHSKLSFKLLLYLLKKNKNNILNNKSKIKYSKTNIKSEPTNFKYSKNINININNKPSKEIININKLTVIDKRNINVFIPGDKKIDEGKEFIYKRKKNSPKNSPILNKKDINLNNNNNNNREDNFIMKKKERNYDGFKNVNYKNKVKIEMNNFVNYIKKKNIFLYLPLLLYRMRILQKMKLVEHKFQCLFNIIKIKEKVNLYYNFHKYRNIICSHTVNYMLSEKKSNTNNNNNPILKNKDKDKTDDNNQNIKLNTVKRYIVNKNKEDNNINNSNYSSNKNENISKASSNSNKSILRNKENNQIQTPRKKNKITFIIKKSEILNKIITKQESKYRKLLLNNIFNKWKNKLDHILSNYKNSKYTNNQIISNKYKSSNIPGKKFIKVRKMKSDRSKNFSQTKSINSGKMSFESDNINVKRMKIQKIKILNNEIKTSSTKDFNPKFKNKKILDNSYFIQKIANISRKISNKNNVFKCFIFWKKKTKENN